MKRGRLLFQFILLFGLVLIGYVLVFGWIERRRVAKGPWEVTFSAEAGRAQLVLNQTNLNIRDVRIVFPGVVAPSNVVERIAFTKAQNPPYPVPFGECIFQDLLFLPGTVTLKLFGHEIQLIPRTLTINRAERPWQNGETIELQAVGTNSSPAKATPVPLKTNSQ
jgi:hypothetical protein